ncbi:MAG: redoxin domain-containing protein [Acidobacteriota bacterium]
MTPILDGRTLMRWLVAAIVAVHLAVAGGMALAATEGTAGSTPPLAAVPGEKAPEFQLNDINGKQVQLSALKSEHPVLVYFWATWCPYCIQVKPKVAELHTAIPESSLGIVSINVGGGDSLERLKKYQEKNPAPYPVLYDGDGKVTRAYKVQGIPMFYLIDKSGDVLYKGNTLPTVEDLKKMIGQ